jgi:polysaccharide biosynthesis/export protein
MKTMSTATFTALSLAALLGTAEAQTTPKPIGTTGTSADTASAAPAASVSNDYRMATGDKLRIEVYKDQQLSQSLQVRPDGKITLPLVGDVPAAGRTSIELRDAITASLKEYIANPVVTVIVVETMPQVVYVQGEVSKPGMFPLTNGRLSVIQAIALAGGFTDFANRKDITIVRGTERLHFNYKDAIDNDSKREPMQLKPGDTVIVK